jgi:hypothetical protein
MKRSKVLELPDDLLAELVRRAIGNNFSGYRGLATWLSERGYAVSPSSIHRALTPFSRVLSLLQAASLVEHATGGKIRMGEAFSALALADILSIAARRKQ